jgi:predicted nucleic acid-binding protein
LIVVDTSVWIAAAKQPIAAKVLADLIEADEVALALPVRLELLAGIARHDRKAFKRRLNAVPQLHPDEDTWPRISKWVEQAADAGEHFTISDLLIASMTAEIGGLLWSLDKDFERMERLKFVSLYQLPH